MYPFFVYVLITFLVSVVAVFLLSKVFPPTGKETPRALKNQHMESGSGTVAPNQIIVDTLTVLGYATELWAERLTARGEGGARRQMNTSLSLFVSEFGRREAETYADSDTRTFRHRLTSHQEVHATVY